MADRLHDSRLVQDTARLVEPPPFDSLLARATTVRRRNRLAAGLISAAIVTALVATGALLTHSARHAAPEPVESPAPTPDSTRTSEPDRHEPPGTLTAEEIIATGDLDSIAWTEAGRSLSTWRVCDENFRRCQYAWQDAGMSYGKLRDNRRASAISTSEHLALVFPNGSISLVDPEHGLQRVEIGDPPLPVEAGHVAVEDRGAFNVLDAPAGKAWHLLTPEDMRSLGDAFIDDQGCIWTIAGREGGKANNVGVYWTTDGETWSWEPLWDHELASAGSIEVAGDHVFAWTAGDGQTIPRPTAVKVSTDSGASWTALDLASLPFETVFGMVTTDDTLFVTTPRGDLWRTADESWQRFEPVPDMAAPYGIESAGNDVYAIQDDDTAFLSNDAGTSWEILDLR